MGFKKIYNCDTCRDVKKVHELYGLNFKNLTEFTIDRAESTEGVHICKNCIRQIQAQKVSEDG